MENIILSIVVPVYNVEKYLSENLESLIHQSAQINYEIIAVNDGSTDTSLKILEEYEKKCSFLKVITQKNGGLSAARNTGIHAARGEYIGFIDSDDFVSKDYIEKMIGMAQQEKSDLVVCDIEFYWGKNNQRNYIMPGMNCNYDHLPLGKRGIVSPLFAWNKIYRKEFFLKQDILYQVGTWYEDLEVSTFLFAKAEKISYVNEVLIYYRQREDSIMSTKSNRCTEIFNVLDRIYNRFNDYNLLQDYQEELCYLFIENLLLYGQYRFLALDSYKELNKKAYDTIKQYFPNYKKNFYLHQLSTKNQFFIRFNNQFTCSLFRQYLLHK